MTMMEVTVCCKHRAVVATCVYVLIGVLARVSCSPQLTRNGGETGEVPAAVSTCQLQSGHCTYQVHLAHGCQGNPPMANYFTNQLQNDHSQRVNEVEKNLVEVRVDHARRIAELENRISALLGQESGRPLGGDNRGTYTASSGSNPPQQDLEANVNFPETPDRQESFLLNQIHKEFEGIRRDLLHNKRRLRDTESVLDRTRHQLNKTEAELLRTTRRLLETESELEDERGTSQSLRSELRDRERALNRTKESFRKTRKELKRTRLDLWNAQMERDDLKKSLEDCRLDLEGVRKALQQALRKYHELNLRHDELQLELNATKNDLVECYYGKTTLYCGFEDSGICGFTQENKTDALDWIRWQSAAPPAWIGPATDHTCQNHKGHYMYVGAQDNKMGQKAVMVSPRYRGYGEQCVEIYYHMHGHNLGTLNLYTMVPGQEVVPMWRVFGNQGNVWSMARLPIPADVARVGYQVVLEATVGMGRDGNIAIDDFRVFDGVCYPSRQTGSSAAAPSLPADHDTSGDVNG